ncbi:MAG: N-acetyltransferase family protein [Bacteroidetes bacterium]|nr:N-acetyltransferase family protein [Bacteroidota bacterium]
MENSTHYRYAELTDIPELTSIYNHYIRHTTATFDLEPVTIENRQEWFNYHNPESRYKIITAIQNETVIGYACTSTFREKAAYATSVESSIYMHPDYTGHGVGFNLYSKLFSLLEETDIHRVYACITIPNPVSISLHTKFQFKKVGLFTEAGFKFGKYRDIQWMEKQLS